jgi:hypothetical protein
LKAPKARDIQGIGCRHNTNCLHSSNPDAVVDELDFIILSPDWWPIGRYWQEIKSVWEKFSTIKDKAELDSTNKREISDGLKYLDLSGVHPCPLLPIHRLPMSSRSKLGLEDVNDSSVKQEQSVI